METVMAREVDSYLTFTIDKEMFATNITDIIEIIEAEHITCIPNSPVFMKGVVNLRGKVLPVLDVRILFNLPAAEILKQTSIIVCNTKEKTTGYFGLLVDSVETVLHIDYSEIKPPPSIGNTLQTQFLEGMILSGDKFIQVLNPQHLISTEKMKKINKEINQ